MRGNMTPFRLLIIGKVLRNALEEVHEVYGVDLVVAL
jgi:hypothetical protein